MSIESDVSRIELSHLTPAKLEALRDAGAALVSVVRTFQDTFDDAAIARVAPAVIGIVGAVKALKAFRRDPVPVVRAAVARCARVQHVLGDLITLAIG